MRSRGVAFTVFVALGLLALFPLVWGQDTTTTIRTSSELVIVPVVVKDRSGRVVSGLKAEDFLILVDNKRQSSTHFEEVRSQGVTGQRKLINNPHEFSNAGMPTSGPMGVTIILLDLVNTPYLYQTLARDQLIGYLGRRPPEQFVTILALTPTGLRQIHDFSNDNEALITSLRQSHSVLNRVTTEGSEVGPTVTGGMERNIPDSHGADFVDQAFRASMIASQRQLTLEAMVQMAEAFKAIPGRKNLVWTTASFPFYLYDPSSFADLTFGSTTSYDSVWRQLNNANISVYPVDVRGVFDPLWESQFSPEHGGTGGSGVGAINFDYWSTRETMRSFADATGGRACLSQNEMARCYAEVAEDGKDFYLLYFYLHPDMRKEGWHKLKVKVNGGYEVRARQGFTIESTDTGVNSDLKMVEALRSPIEDIGIQFSLELGKQHSLAESRTVLNLPGLENKRRRGNARFPVAAVPFKIRISKDSLFPDLQQHDKFAVRIDAAAVTENNEVLAVFSKIVEGNLVPDSLKKSPVSVFTFTDAVALPAGKLRVRFAVLDAIGQRLGTVEAPIEIVETKQVAQSKAN